VVVRRHNMKLESNKWYSVSEHKLLAEEIEGRIVLSVHNDGATVQFPQDFSAKEVAERIMYVHNPATRYILLDLPEEQLMDLDGVKGKIEVGIRCLIVRYEKPSKVMPGFNEFNLNLYSYDTSRSEAIHAANEFISRIKGG
jgi:hypothetical protein